MDERWPQAAAADNPPGQASLAYRVGGYGTFFDQMLDRLMSPQGSSSTLASLPTVVAPRGVRDAPPLDPVGSIRPNLTDADNWLVGLLKAWASAADVLVFYQERLVQEGFLRTARELRSVVELARLLHVSPRPPTAGRVDLAFTISDVEGLPRRVALERRTAVRSMPHEGAPAQVFETDEELLSEARWNLLRPAPPRHASEQAVGTDATSVLVDGTTTGLVPGSMVLVMGSAEGRQVQALKRVHRVEARPAADPPATEITWAGPLVEGSSAKLDDVEVHALRAEARLFGTNAPMWAEQPLAVKQAAQPLRGGVMVAEPAGFRSRNEGLPAATVQALAADRQGTLYATPAGEGVMRSVDRGESWMRVDRGLQEPDVLALAVAGNGVYAGTSSGGVYRSSDRGAVWEPLFGRATASQRRRITLPGVAPPPVSRLPSTAVRSLAVVRREARTTLLAGTDSGLFRSDDHGASWRADNRGLPGVDARTGETDLAIAAIATAGEGAAWWLATARGAFRRAAGAGRWRPTNHGLPATDPFSGLSSTAIAALAVFTDRQGVERAVAGTDRGVVIAAGEQPWQPPASQPTASGSEATVHALIVHHDPVTVETDVYAGTDDGLWRSSNAGASWQPVPLGAATQVLAVAAGGGLLAVATPSGGFDLDEWPGFHPAADRIDLDRVVPGLLAGGWIALRSDDLELEKVLRVERAGTVFREDFGLAATVTRALVGPDPGLTRFPLRRTDVFALDEPLALARPLVESAERAIGGLRALLATLPPDRPAIAATSALVAVRPAGGDDAEPADVAAPDAAVPEDTDPDTAAPDTAAPDTAAPDTAAPDTAAPDTAGADAADLPAPLIGGRPARAVRSTVAELERELGALAAASEPDGGVLTEAGIVSAPPGPEIAELRVYANVVAATEGNTVDDEVLGDGDASVAFQRFVLGQPLAFLPGSPPRPDLEVRVRGERWQRVARLADQDADARVYRLDVEPDGRATIVFGDGKNGARLPTDRANVTATYRTGLAPFAPAANTINQPVSRPLGLAGVTNPAGATPGAPAETLDALRARTPHAVRILGRVVSVHDHADFAATFPGIAKARAWRIADPDGGAVLITVAATGGRPIPPGAPLLRDLRAALLALRAGDSELSILDHQPVRLHIGGTVQHDRRFRAEQVRQAMRARLTTRFGFDTARFEGMISAAEVVEALQSLEAVRGVDLDVFVSDHPLPEEAPPLRWRRARPPRRRQPASTTLVAAELVTVAADPDLVLEAVK